jgi:hypothetical protein
MLTNNRLRHRIQLKQRYTRLHTFAHLRQHGRNDPTRLAHYGNFRSRL